MCEQALYETGRKIGSDKYQKNWGSLLEYLDLSSSQNVSEMMLSAFPHLQYGMEAHKRGEPKSSQANTSNSHITVKNHGRLVQAMRVSSKFFRADQSSFQSNRRKPGALGIPTPSASLGISPEEYKKKKAIIRTSDNALSKAVYKMQKSDDISGFTNGSIIGTYYRLKSQYPSLSKRNNASESHPPETFPEHRIVDEITKPQFTHQESQDIVQSRTQNAWIEQYNKVPRIQLQQQDRETQNFLQSLFHSWDHNVNGNVEVQTIVSGLLELGLNIEYKLIQALAIELKQKSSFRNMKDSSLSLGDFLNLMRLNVLATQIADFREKIANKERKSKEQYRTIRTPKGPGRILSVQNKSQTLDTPYMSSSKNFLDIPEKKVDPCIRESEKVLRKFENTLRPYKNNRLNKSMVLGWEQSRDKPKLPIKEEGDSKQGTTLQDVMKVQSLWSEMTLQAGGRELLSLHFVITFLLEKGLVHSKEQVKEALGIPWNSEKAKVDYVMFKDLCNKTKIKSASLHISGRKNNLMRKTVHVNVRTPQKKGVPVMISLKRRQNMFRKQQEIGVSTFTHYDYCDSPSIQISPDSINLQDSSLDHRIAIQRYREAVTENPDSNQYLVLHG